MMTWIVPIISNLLVAGAIAFLAWLTGRSDRRAALAHLLWMAFFVKLVTPPIILFPVAIPIHWFASLSLEQADWALSSQSSSRPNDAGVVPTHAPFALASPDAQGSTSGFRSWLQPSILILGVWASGFAYCLTRGVLRFLRFHRLLRSEGCPDHEAGRFVAALIDTYAPGKRSPQRAPSVLRIPLRISPMLFGLGHWSVIVCPEMLWKSLSEQEKQAFLAHETAHYCRRDHWVRWMEFVVTAIYWWNPLVYVARQQLERHEEACCDEWAVRILNSPPRQYADSLLKVVDFISENQVRVPRMASAMQPTKSLEMRLRLVMQIGKRPKESRSTKIGFAMAGVLLLMLHPFPQPIGTTAQANTSNAAYEPSPLQEFTQRSPSFDNTAVETLVLPQAPKGFWNQLPEPQWAEFALSLPGVQLRADVARGLAISTPEGDSLRFSPDELRAIVEIPGSRRVIIGSRDGSVRLWDLDAGTPVSLLGRHSQEVTSLAYHENGGLLSSDAAGSVMRWDMQSGQVLATASVPASRVQSIRFSADGQSIAVLTGRWDATRELQQVYILENSSLQITREIRMRHQVALVAAADNRWVSVDWTGTVRDLGSETEIGRIPKQRVSAMLLSQNVTLPAILSDSGY